MIRKFISLNTKMEKMEIQDAPPASCDILNLMLLVQKE